MRKVFIYGAGGHGRVIADILQKSDTVRLQGFIDDNPALTGRRLMGIPVLGTGENLRRLMDEGIQACIVGIADNALRRRIVTQIEEIGFVWIQAIHPKAVLGMEVELGQGAAVMALAVVNPGARIGMHSIINTSAIVEHDNVIGSFVHISPGAHLAGGVVVGDGAHIGTGATLIPNVRIGRNVVVGAQAAVIRDLEDDVLAVGVPARVVRKHSSVIG